MLEYFLCHYGATVMNAILCAVFGCIGFAVKRLYARYLDDDTKRSVARAVAQFVEQVWKDLHGEDKLQKALETAEDLLKKKGVPFDAQEMEILIEAAVAEFNEAFRKPLLEEGATDAPYRGPETSKQ